jgi:hypothetical protein
MAVLPKAGRQSLIADKTALIRILEEQDARTGFVLDPTATAQKARQMMLRDGVRPEQNEFSREIIRIRDEE